MKKLKRQTILNIAASSDGFEMSKYKDSHEYIRKICRKLQKEKLIKIAYHTRDSVIFENRKD